MSIGPDVLVFISATEASLQSLRHQPLNEEELAELECCLRELTAQLSEDQTRHAARLLSVRCVEVCGREILKLFLTRIRERSGSALERRASKDGRRRSDGVDRH